ncbi:MAG: hypothetical protein ACR2PK_10510 [Acidimicrobiales bacterium]
MIQQRALQLIHLGLAVAYVVFALVGDWSKVPEGRENIHMGIFDSQGGTGFGILALIIGAILIVLAIMRILGRTRVLPGLGVEQLTIILGVSATLIPIAYIVGWLKLFDYGTGWAVVALYFTGSFIPQLGLLTASEKEPVIGVKPITPGPRRTLSIVTLLAAAGVALFPFLEWVSSGGISLTGYEPGGVRSAMILIFVGAPIGVGAIMRMRPQGLAEPGPNILLPHALLAGGLLALVVPLAHVISVYQFDGPTLNVGVGVWLGLVASIVLIAAALWENHIRGAKAA